VEKPIKKKNILMLFILGVFLSLGASLLLLRSDFNYQKSLRTPFDIVVANTTTDSTQIYWKVKEEDFQILSYKKETFTGPYTQAFNDVLLYKDNISNSNLYITKIENLEPNTRYIFKIDSAKGIEKKEFSFKTKEIKEEVITPNIVTGDTNIDKLVLMSLDSGDNIMLDTAKHGTWAFDNQGEEYKQREYAQITTEEELVALIHNILAPKIYAAREKTGSNCMVDIKVNNYNHTAIDKATFVDKAENGIYTNNCRKGNYANECFDDVYCTSLEKGVDPAFPLTIWFQETGASNYAKADKDGVQNLKDFGIKNSNIYFDFRGQLDWLLNNVAKEEYINTCTLDTFTPNRIENWISDKDINSEFSLNKNSKLFKNIQWATKFVLGDKKGKGCNSKRDLVSGLLYYSKTLRNYKHVLLDGTSGYNNIEFPFKIERSSSYICDHSNQKMNTIYKNCDNNDIEKNNVLGSSTGCNDDPSGNTDIIEGEICTDRGGCDCFEKRDENNKPENYKRLSLCGEKCKVSPRGSITLNKLKPEGTCNTDDGCTCNYYDNKNNVHIYKGQTCLLNDETIMVAGEKSSEYKHQCCGDSLVPTPSPSPSPSPTPNPDPNPPDGNRDEMVVTNKDRYCEDPNGCICLYDKEGNNYKTRLEAEHGYTCTVDKKIIKTEKICCFEDNKLSVKMPSDCNGVLREDIPITNCKNTNAKYQLKKGVSFINPVEVLDTTQTLHPKTAYDLINMSDKRAIAVGEYKSGEWIQVVKYQDGKIYGNDFELDSNKSYMVISLQGAEFNLIGYRGASLDISKLSGWNLVPSYLFDNKGYTSYEILKNLEFNKIKQIGQWQDSKSLFEYTIKNDKNEIYGEELKIGNQSGVFIKVLQ
jgi:hypothetical protein